MKVNRKKNRSLRRQRATYPKYPDDYGWVSLPWTRQTALGLERIRVDVFIGLRSDGAHVYKGK